MKLLFALLIFTLSVSCSHKQYDNPHVLIVTNYGDIEAELYPKNAPKTVSTFLSYIDSGFYNNTTFYRVLKNEDLNAESNYGMIQGGLWPHPKNLPGIVHESTKQTGLKHIDGTLSLARIVAGSATTEFFICVGEQQAFDAGGSATSDSLGFAAFGRVVEGMDVVRKIQDQKNTGDMFDKKITITTVKKL